MDKKTLQKIERIINYKFSDRELLQKAFTHSSSVDSRLASNERLEFLGDAILGTVVCETIFEKFPEYLEGDMTQIKSMLVSRSTCAKIVKKLDLHKFLKIGKGMANSRSLSGSLAAGVFEAIIAAVYIDGGFEAAQNFILANFNSLFEHADEKRKHDNFKSLLQQHAQQHFNIAPVYLLLDEKGPDHDKCFEAEAVIADRHFPSAWGNNKKQAEQKAAFAALKELGVL